MKLYTCNDTCLYINRDYDIADMNKCSWHLSDDNNLFNSLFRRKYRLGSYRWSIKQGKPVLDFNVLEEFHFDVLKKSIDCKSCDKDGYFLHMRNVANILRRCIIVMTLLVLSCDLTRQRNNN